MAKHRVRAFGLFAVSNGVMFNLPWDVEPTLRAAEIQRDEEDVIIPVIIEYDDKDRKP